MKAPLLTAIVTGAPVMHAATQRTSILMPPSFAIPFAAVSLVGTPGPASEPATSRFAPAAPTVRLLTVTSPCRMTLAATLMQASSELPGARPVVQLPAVVQKPSPLLPVHELVQTG